jgi:DNA-directed RNA polymerase specialized sigma54-like protein
MQLPRKKRDIPQQPHKKGPRKPLYQSEGASWILTILEANPDRLEEIVELELAENPFLVEEVQDNRETETSDSALSDPESEGDSVAWNDDFDRPADEYETGEFEEDINDEDRELIYPVVYQQGENYDEPLRDLMCTGQKKLDYGVTDESEMKREREPLDLLLPYCPPPDRPTFTVDVSDNGVVVRIVPTLADRVAFSHLDVPKSKSIKDLTDRAHSFLSSLKERRRFLESIGRILLEDIQAHFFLQSNIEDAIKHLIPIKTQDLNTLGFTCPIKMEKATWSRIGDLVVEHQLGMFKLETFWPSHAALLRAWVHFAYQEGYEKRQSQLTWIKHQVEEIAEKHNSHQTRLELLQPLLNIGEVDIKNARSSSKKLPM